MWVLVAIDAVNLFGPMLLTVTGCTEWHQFVIIVFAWVVCMKNLMALLAGKAVLTS